MHLDIFTALGLHLNLFPVIQVLDSSRNLLTVVWPLCSLADEDSVNSLACLLISACMAVIVSYCEVKNWKSGFVN